MKLFSKPVLTWKQPEAFRLSQARLTPWWLRPLVLVVFIVLVLFSREINKLNPNREHIDSITALLRGLGCGFLIVYLLPWLMSLARYDVYLYSDGIQKMGQQIRLSFKNMAGFNWSKEDSYYVLRLIDKKERTFLYGVPPLAIREAIEAVLRQNGLQEIPH